MPIYGKLGDLYGRKRMYLVAMTLFTVGSMLCGAAGSLGQLIAFRAAAGDRRRRDRSARDGDRRRHRPGPSARAVARLPGGARSPIASLIGPFTGGFFVDHLDLAVGVLREPPARRRRVSDRRRRSLHVPYREGRPRDRLRGLGAAHRGARRDRGRRGDRRPDGAVGLDDGHRPRDRDRRARGRVRAARAAVRRSRCSRCGSCRPASCGSRADSTSRAGRCSRPGSTSSRCSSNRSPA